MPACPNCGRQTQRTKDWACQWCGYPLISRAFKKIDKTFKELQEERSLSARSGETEADFEPEVEAEPEPEERPRIIRGPQLRPRPAPQPEPRPEPAPEVEPPPRSLPQPAPRPESRPEPEPELEPPPQPVPRLAPRPAPPPEPEPVPVLPVPLESIRDGMEITVDQLNALFKTEKSGAHTRFVDKVVVVKGVVEKVFVREHLEIRYIVLTGSQKKVLWSVRCSFEKEGSTGLNRLNEGQDVAIRGKYDGYGKNIIFKNCSLV